MSADDGSRGAPGPRAGRALGPFRALGATARAGSLRRTLDARPAGPLWVFAYGSLLWRPCFVAAESRLARVEGHMRAFSMWTVSARGSPHAPGLGLVLEAGPGFCEGLLLRLGEETLERDLERLWEREMLTGIYRPAWLDAHTAGETVRALAFVADHAHPQYARDLSLVQRARYIASASGELGTCYDYLRATVCSLRAHGIHDPALHDLLSAVRGERARAGAGGDAGR